MRDIPFNVSARTARLIGRENVSSAEGALIELVKNSYDADAKNCIVYFDDTYADIPHSISIKDFESFGDFLHKNKIEFVKDYFEPNLASSSYEFLKNSYEKNISEKSKKTAAEIFSKTVMIHIIDDGHGMTEDVIENSWMTIGTDDKNINFVSKATGRIKSGAKGIGRFALDRLGEHCSMFTKTKPQQDTVLWAVDWADFDVQGKTINEVNAKIGPSAQNLEEISFNLLQELKFSNDLPDFKTEGTHIRISGVRDVWSYRDIQKIYQELESLIPPVEAGDFKVYVLSKRFREDFGQVQPNICDDFDYKLSAEMDELGNVKFEVTRREIDSKKLPDEMLKREFFITSSHSRNYLTGQPFHYTKTFYELLPGLREKDDNAHEKVGALNFTLYFLKRLSNKKDSEIFLHREINGDARKRWLDNNNGIRIFRDNFRVRPYGEIGKASWDWLGLGRRQAEDPSSLRTGRWKVTPNNISGVVNISRLSNLGLEDKSSREGIQENQGFSLFKSLLEAMIKEFENDRSSIYKEVYSFYQEKKVVPTEDDISEAQEEDAEKIALKIFDEIKKEQAAPVDDSTKLALALLKEKARSREIDDRLEDMKKENSLLRVFASSGITIASFTHELDSLNAKLGNRFDQLENLIRSYADMSPEDRITIQNFKNPYTRIEMLKRDDERVKNWIKYSLRTIRKDKRQRININIKNYLENLKTEWLSTLADRQIDIIINNIDPAIFLRAYEIDLDCIFNNLIINSSDAFKRPGFSGDRNIYISAYERGNKVLFSYRDSGPGLSKDILDPLDIFKPTFTTKKNSQGEEIGTGLGMWLLEKTVEEYGGSCEIVQDSGFALNWEL